MAEGGGEGDRGEEEEGRDEGKMGEKCQWIILKTIGEEKLLKSTKPAAHNTAQRNAAHTDLQRGCHTSGVAAAESRGGHLNGRGEQGKEMNMAEREFDKR